MSNPDQTPNTPTRIERIQAMLADDPHDTFLRYSLAMEQEKAGEFSASQAGFRSLTEDRPPYVPAFFMAAQYLVKRNQLDAARERLRDGIEQARLQGDSHAAGEMSEFLASLGSLA